MKPRALLLESYSSSIYGIYTILMFILLAVKGNIYNSITSTYKIYISAMVQDFIAYCYCLSKSALPWLQNSVDSRHWKLDIYIYIYGYKSSKKRASTGLTH